MREKRLRERINVDLCYEMRCTAQTEQVQLQDLSISGAKLFTSEKVHSNEQGLLMIHLESGDQRVEIPCKFRVIWTCPSVEQEGYYEVGVTFRPPEGAAGLHLLRFILRQLAPVTTEEKLEKVQ